MKEKINVLYLEDGLSNQTLMEIWIEDIAKKLGIEINLVIKDTIKDTVLYPEAEEVDLLLLDNQIVENDDWDNVRYSINYLYDFEDKFSNAVLCMASSYYLDRAELPIDDDFEIELGFAKGEDDSLVTLESIILKVAEM